MSDPWQQIKQLPWLTLFQAAILTTIVAVLVELILGFSFQFEVVRMTLKLLLSGVFQAFTVLGVAIALGALSVVILERLNRFNIRIASLWALVLCLAITVGIVQLIGLFAIGIVGVSYMQIVGFVLGIFWKGRPYWQHYKRW